MTLKELTRAELEIMKILWQKSTASVHDIRDAITEPKPAYNTVSTIVRILEKKGFAGHEIVGKIHRFYPVVGREQYTEQFMDGVLGNFFGGSVVQMVSFFTRRDNVSMKDFDTIIGMLEELKNGDPDGGSRINPKSGENSKTEEKNSKRIRLWTRS